MHAHAHMHDHAHAHAHAHVHARAITVAPTQGVAPEKALTSAHAHAAAQANENGMNIFEMPSLRIGPPEIPSLPKCPVT